MLFKGHHFGDKFKTEDGKTVILLTEPQRNSKVFYFAYAQRQYISHGQFRSYATFTVDKDGKVGFGIKGLDVVKDND